MDAAIYYTSATISGCFSGLIAYGVTKNLEGVHGRHSRQWLYIIEAIPAIALGLLFLVCFPSFPEKVVKSGHRLFSAEELLLIEQRNNSSENSAPCGLLISSRCLRSNPLFFLVNAAHASVKVEQIWVALREPKVYLMAFAVRASGLSIGAISSFLPTFIKGFGFSSRMLNPISNSRHQVLG
jgi:MFS family permease